MKDQRYILTGKYTNGDSYFETFDSEDEMNHSIEQIEGDWMGAMFVRDGLIIPMTLETEIDKL